MMTHTTLVGQSHKPDPFRSAALFAFSMRDVEWKGLETLGPLCVNQNHKMHNYTLQKQVGCFNHRVVTMVADKLKRQWL